MSDEATSLFSQMNKTLRILDIVEDTMVDGPGLRTSIYCAGCGHACKECHNPQSWNFDGGKEMTVSQVLERIMSNKFDDVTFSGGDPMYQADSFVALAREIRAHTSKTIWCYTGFLYESLLNMPAQKALLEEIDVLVDGPYIPALRDIQLRFRGSSNQRMIDVKASLQKGSVVMWKNN